MAIRLSLAQSPFPTTLPSYRCTVCGRERLTPIRTTEGRTEEPIRCLYCGQPHVLSGKRWVRASG